MIVGKNRATKLVVDLHALQQNIKNEKKLLQSQTEIFAVVKANGYGHGLIEVAKAAVGAGATGLCVAILDEALALREAAIIVPILVLGITETANAKLAQENNISLTVGSLEWLHQYQQINGDATAQENLKVHLVVDTGMGRIGFRDVDQLAQAVLLVRNAPFEFEGIFTHFATADETDDSYFKQQLNTWHLLTDQIDKMPRYVHVANSATSLWHLPVTGNMIRLGITMYGLNPAGTAIAAPFALQPVLRLESHLNFVKQIKAGSFVSYGATYQASSDEWIGTIPIGYADGYPRRMQGFHVLINGQFCEIVGRVCMDQMMIKLPAKLSVGTRVTLIGQQNGQQISCDDVAQYAETINYEILTSMAPRLQREYLN